VCATVRGGCDVAVSWRQSSRLTFSHARFAFSIAYSNIQVDNPVAVLDQDEAKKFLMGKAEDKYAFFMKATELERVDQTYASTLETVEELTFSNESQRKMLATQHEDMLKLKQKWEEHQELGKLELKLQRMNTEFGWALYNEMDGRYNEALEVSLLLP